MQLKSLVNSVADQCSKQIIGFSESSPKFLYFNKLNLAYKSTLHNENKLLNSYTTPEVLRIITDIHRDTSRYLFTKIQNK